MEMVDCCVESVHAVIQFVIHTMLPVSLVSDFIENIEEMFSLYYMHSDVHVAVSNFYNIIVCYPLRQVKCF